MGQVQYIKDAFVNAITLIEVIWKALLNIPRGKTATYSQIAKLIGKPKASRAVGNATGKNPIAFLIPCHRVIRTDGSLGGFRWGTNCKAKILGSELA